MDQNTPEAKVATPLESTVESSPPKGRSKGFIFLVSILLLLILGLGGYYIFTQYFAPEKVEQVQEQNSEGTDDQEEIANDSELEESSEYVMKNKGWALYSLPDYEFSAELSPYTMSEEIEEYTPTWNWIVNLTSREDNLYPNYQKGVFIKFYPDNLEPFRCGGGCAKEHWFLVSIYEKTEGESLNDVAEIYLENVKKAGESENYVPTVTQEQIKKWENDVIAFTRTTPADMGELEGYILVSSKFVYVIETFQSELPVESYQESRKVLDSFTFGK